jgi:hypothetical protein
MTSVNGKKLIACCEFHEHKHAFLFWSEQAAHATSMLVPGTIHKTIHESVAPRLSEALTGMKKSVKGMQQHPSFAICHNILDSPAVASALGDEPDFGVARFDAV